MSMITASLWVPRGAAAAFPEKYNVDEDELARISKLAKLQLEDAKGDLTEATNGRRGDTETEDSDVEENGGRTERSQVYVILLRTNVWGNGLIDAQRRG